SPDRSWSPRSSAWRSSSASYDKSLSPPEAEPGVLLLPSPLRAPDLRRVRPLPPPGGALADRRRQHDRRGGEFHDPRAGLVFPPAGQAAAFHGAVRRRNQDAAVVPRPHRLMRNARSLLA